MPHAQCFGSQNHRPTENANRAAILRSNRLARQKSVVKNDDAKAEREERPTPEPGTGAGPMEVGGGAAAVVESRSARPPSEGAGVGDLVPLQKRIPARSWRADLLPRRACVDPQRAAHIPGDVAARRAPAGAAPPASSARARRSRGGAGGGARGAAPGGEGHGRSSSCLLFPGSGRPAPSPAPLPSLPRIRPAPPVHPLEATRRARGTRLEAARRARWRKGVAVVLLGDKGRTRRAGTGLGPEQRRRRGALSLVLGSSLENEGFESVTYFSVRDSNVE